MPVSTFSGRRPLAGPAAAAAAAAVLLAAGCATHAAPRAAGTASARQAVALTAQRAAKLRSFTEMLSVTISGQQDVAASGTMRLQTQPVPLAAVDMSKIEHAGQALPGGVQEVVTNRAIYLRVAALGRLTGKPWVRVTLAELRKISGLSVGGLLQQVQDSNPLVQARMLASSSDVRAAGTAVIDGVKTTRYTGTYPLSAGLARVPASMRSAAAQQLAAMGIKAAHFTVWIDAAHQTRKLIVSLRGSSETIQTTMTVTSINQPVTITVPPASQVRTLSAGQLGT